MHSQLNYLIAQQRSADLNSAGERDRLAAGPREPRPTSRRRQRTGQLTTLMGRLTARRAHARV
jgi:hypothetical protein